MNPAPNPAPIRSATLDLRGLWVPIVTPFQQNGSLDELALKRLATRLLGDGAAGLVALGTTGEPATLSAEERLRVVEICASSTRSAGKPLIVGAGSNATRATITEIESLSAIAGVQAALVVVPYYTRPSEAAVVEHFQIVAGESPVPIIIYNVPYRTGRGLGAASIVSLAEHHNIIGLKQAVGCIDGDTLDLLRHELNNFAVLAGDDAFIAPSVFMGAHGAIAAAAHLATSMFVEMVSAALARDVARAVQLAHSLLPMVDAGFAEPNPAVWKGALHQRGELSSGQLRRPMTPASSKSVHHLLDSIPTRSHTTCVPT